MMTMLNRRPARVSLRGREHRVELPFNQAGNRAVFGFFIEFKGFVLGAVEMDCERGNAQKRFFEVDEAVSYVL